MPSSAPSPLLAAEHLTVGYRLGRQIYTVAQNLKLQASAGQLICLLGPNGCGKSTLLRTLAGMQPALAGQIILNRKPLASFSPMQRATQLAVVLTEAPDANLTAYDLVATGRYPYTGWLGRSSDEDRHAVTEALRRTGTLDFVHRPISTLSDGERQKVVVARAVAQSTPLLILDEPTAHLDVPNRVAVLQLLHRLAHEHKKTVLLSTHALDLALLVADQLWLMYEGKLQSGVPEDLVLDGALAAVFERQGVVFDQHTGTFGISRPAGRPLRIEGASTEAFWTRRALERSGYTLAGASADALLVRVMPGPPPRWEVETAASLWQGSSIEALLQYLKEQNAPQ